MCACIIFMLYQLTAVFQYSLHPAILLKEYAYVELMILVTPCKVTSILTLAEQKVNHYCIKTNF